MQYLLNSKGQETAISKRNQKSAQQVILLTTEEAMERYKELGHFSQLEHNMKNHTIQYCKADLMDDCIMGTLLVPDKKNPVKDGISLTYYLNECQLILVDHKDHMESIEKVLENTRSEGADHASGFFAEFLEFQIREDMAELIQFEEVLGKMEEDLGNQRTFSSDVNHQILNLRRKLLLLSSFYQQMEDMCAELKENTGHFFSEEDVQILESVSKRCGRFLDHTRVLREYALQIREMYQSQIAIRQNDTMRILTMITTIFFPLSLVTGWYGMNFINMPELRQPYGYFILAGICLLMVVLEVIFFKKKKWL